MNGTIINREEGRSGFATPIRVDGWNITEQRNPDGSYMIVAVMDLNLLLRINNRTTDFVRILKEKEEIVFLQSMSADALTTLIDRVQSELDRRIVKGNDDEKIRYDLRASDDRN